MKDIITLAVESSCDETSVAVLKNGREVLSNIINTQVDLHKKFGGVVPEVASRKHIENIDVVLQEALDKANITLDDIDHIAVTYGPGLVGALLVGLSHAKALSFTLNKPLVGVNHIEGHVSANYIEHKDDNYGTLFYSDKYIPSYVVMEFEDSKKDRIKLFNTIYKLLAFLCGCVYNISHIAQAIN